MLVDSMVGYRFMTARKVEANVELNVRNAFEKEYVVAGDPRRVTLGVDLRF